jgi:ketosteroid isomerase-like protein
MKNVIQGSLIGVITLVVFGAVPLFAYSNPTPARADSLSAEAFMNRFHDSVAGGDSTAVASGLADDVTIAEGGSLQTRSEYLSHHFRGDARFLGSLTRKSISTSTRMDGNTAVVVSTSRLSGSFNDRSIDMISLETAVLERFHDTWKIVSIHWSSGRP